MALRDQPYIPFYVDDWLTDEKLIECSAESQGVYIRIMCCMHKSEKYGTILLQQKDQQSDQQVKNFAIKFAKRMPFSVDVIESSINELVSEGVLQLNDNVLSQKRMVKDNELSLKRAKAGSKGGFATAKNTANGIAKDIANTVNVNEDVVVSRNVLKDENKKKPSKHKYGEYKHVLLTDEQHRKLIEDFGIAEVNDMIENLDKGIEMKGYKYKNHNLALRKWRNNKRVTTNKNKYGPQEVSKEHIKDVLNMEFNW
jgi:hypothetical protein